MPARTTLRACRFGCCSAPAPAPSAAGFRYSSASSSVITPCDLQEQHEPRVMVHLDVLREEALERHHHVLRRAPAIARLLLEAAIDDVLELARDLGVHACAHSSCFSSRILCIADFFSSSTNGFLPVTI